MGKKNKEKKKGKGAEKTAAKTDKKLSTKLKKDLLKLGEDDIESIVAKIEQEEKKRLETTEIVTSAPTRRLNFTLISHPDKEQLILFGGEFYNGQKTFIYNDLFFYNISANQWSIVKTPSGPPPRCGHQMIATASNKGQLWMFGGEFASPSQAQFYHYRDLWVYHLAARQWEKVQAPNGPSARSGHRMIYAKKNLIVFGGFHDNLRDYKYFNDVYAFNIESYKWMKLEPSGNGPEPRSACCMVALNDGRILIYGGYSKSKVKKDVDQGQVYTNSFLLTPEKNDTSGTKWKWVQVKLSGEKFSPRCSMPITSTPNNTFAYCYGGVFDIEDEDEELSGVFYNNFYQLDLEKLSWKLIENKQQTIKSDIVEIETVIEEVESTTIADDGIFKVSIGPTNVATSSTSTKYDDKSKVSFQPSPRINSGLTVKHGILYLYGGMYEDGDKQVTLNDFYSIDLKKLEKWNVIIEDDTSKMEWLGSDSGSSESDDQNDSSDDSDEESQSE